MRTRRQFKQDQRKTKRIHAIDSVIAYGIAMAVVAIIIILGL